MVMIMTMVEGIAREAGGKPPVGVVVPGLDVV